MPTPLLLLGWTVAVVLCLYAFHCFWEAGRAALSASSRSQVLRIAGGPQTRAMPVSAPAYRMRACVSLAASTVLGLLVLLFAR
jgi:hypothetical protein